jgi:hypothetical protein
VAGLSSRNTSRITAANLTDTHSTPRPLPVLTDWEGDLAAGANKSSARNLDLRVPVHSRASTP